MPQSPIATAADYADAMIIARRAKNWLFALLLLMILAQVGIFFAARYMPHLLAGGAEPSDRSAKAFALLRYVVGIIDFLGIALAVVLSMVLLLLAKIMLVGRLIGVAKVTSAYIWCLLFIVLVFPWQAFLSNPSQRPGTTVSPATVAAGSTSAMEPATTALASINPAGNLVGNPEMIARNASTPALTAAPDSSARPPLTDFKVPGALYTWTELTHPIVGARFGISTPADMPVLILRWSRYVVFPVIALLILLAVQMKSARGLRMALGESDYDLAQSPTA